jgi:putative ABC transport system permease protein
VEFGTLIKDMHFGARALLRPPGSAIVSVIVLALGIGLSTFMFSIVYGVFFRGIDVPDASRLMMIDRSDVNLPDQFALNWPIEDFLEIRERTTSFDAIAGYWEGTVNVADTEAPERYDGVMSTANLMAVLRVQPVLGRGFRDGDDSPAAPPTVVLGYRVWQDRFAGDPGVLGKVLRVNGEQSTVIGVMPEGFQFPDRAEIYVPMRIDALAHARWQGRFLSVIGRVRDGSPWDRAALEVSATARELEQEFPETNQGMGALPQTFVQANTGPQLTTLFSAMMVAVLLVLVVACANVANLLLARGAMRTKEAAVRVAMGAGRLRVMFPFFAEALVLAAAGSVLGIAIAFFGVSWFDAATVGELTGRPSFMVFKVDLPILAFVIGLTGFTALLAGAAPALQVSRADVNGVLKDESRGSSSFHMGRLANTLVVAEVALSCALLVGAGLMMKSIIRFSQYQTPFAKDAHFTARVGLFEADYPEREDRQSFLNGLQRRLDRDPSIGMAALTTNLPGGFTPNDRIRLEGVDYPDPRDRPEAHRALVGPGFFDVMGVGLLEGSDFTLRYTLETDRVAIVNRSMARSLWPDGSPLGRRFRTGTADTISWVRVIGVAPDLEMAAFSPVDQPGGQQAGYYLPISQYDPRFVSIAALPMPGVAPLSITAEVRELVRGLDPNLPIYQVRTIEDLILRNTWFYSVFGKVFIAFGLAALFMASVGLYGVLSFSVSRRIREMGIRMALGAGARDVLGLVVKQGMTQLGVGLSLGLAMAWLVSRVVAVVMFEVNPRDPSVFGVVVGVIVVVSLAASLVPARRATGVDPIVALRNE